MPRPPSARPWTLLAIPVVLGLAAMVATALVATRGQHREATGEASASAATPEPAVMPGADAPATSAPTSEGTDRLRILVRDGLGLPLLGARVTAWTLAHEPTVSRTDAAGRCELPSSGTAFVTVEHADFAPVVAAHEAQTARVFDLASRQGVAVIVRDALGRPVEGARITATPSPWPASWPPIQPRWTRTAVTDQLGGATLHRLAAGVWRITARVPAGLGASRSVSTRARFGQTPIELQLPPSQPRPGTIRWSDGRPAVGATVQPVRGTAIVTDGNGRFELPQAVDEITVAVEGGVWRGPGPESLADGEAWEVELPAGPAVDGTVRIGDRSPAGVEVWATAVDGQPLVWGPGIWEPRAITDDAGRFRLVCASPGRFTVHASSSGRPFARRDIDAPSSAPVRITGAIAPVTGFVRAADGAVPNAMVELLDSPELRIVARARSDDAGRFRLGVLAGSGYVLRASAPGLAPRWVPDVKVPVEGATLAAIELSPAEVLRGRALRADGTPAAGAQVMAIGPEPSPVPPRLTQADSQGWFAFEGIPSGSIHLFYSFLSTVPAERSACAAATRIRIDHPLGTDLVLQPQ